MKHLTVGELLKEQRERLKLQLITGAKALKRRVTTPEVNRPGLALSGYPEHFRAERIQIIGRGEHHFCLKADTKVLEANLEKMLAHPTMPCLVITRKLSAPKALVKARPVTPRSSAEPFPFP